MTAPSTPFAALLARFGRDPSSPLLTDVDLRSGERVELSAASAANGAIKAAHLVAGVAHDLGRAPLLQLRLPVHWQAVTLALGTWGAGGCLLSTTGIDPEVAAGADALVLGPAEAEELPDDLPDVVWASRLHPFGLPFAEAPRYPVEDLSVALRAQPDTAPPDQARASDHAVVLDGVPSTYAELMARGAALGAALGAGGRILTCLPWSTTDGWVAAAVLPVVTQGSVVLVRGAPGQPAGPGDGLSQLCAAERVTATAGVTLAGLPRLC